MIPSTCKELVVWTPPPQCEVVLDTRRSYHEYVKALQQHLDFDSRFDYVHFMAELGEVVTAVMCRDLEFDTSLRSVMRHHQEMIPSSITEKDAITHLSLRFQHLCQQAHEQTQRMHLYDKHHYLPYFFMQWSMGCLVLRHITY